MSFSGLYAVFVLFPFVRSSDSEQEVVIEGFGTPLRRRRLSVCEAEPNYIHYIIGAVVNLAFFIYLLFRYKFV